ncbi:MAG TPA: hypothetical protein VGW96_08625, partial [Candidatus Eremiobacteraceae bacterium]|nr:hypothetical protein [Candidatus Eremiobacteraceae bacterium]
MVARLVFGGALIGVIAIAYMAATQPEPIRIALVIVAALAALALLLYFVPARNTEASLPIVEQQEAIAPSIAPPPEP